jgi:hypothetical protein
MNAAKLILVTTMLFGANIASGLDAENSFPQSCAQRDLQVLTLIEQRGATHTIPGQQVASEFLALLDARATCAREGAAAGLARYDSAVSTSEVSTARK